MQTVRYGSSCTGTAILLIAACRAVGIPARMAGCSESIVAGGFL
jgi:transglutaminase-like putative cysteine protease